MTFYTFSFLILLSLSMISSSFKFIPSIQSHNFNSLNQSNVHSSYSSQSHTLKQTCNYTNFQYLSMQQIANNTFLKQTFTNLSKTLRSVQPTYVNNGNGIFYVLFVQSINYYYNDTQQTASFGTNQIIYIEGGELTLQFNLSWSKRNYSGPQGRVDNGIGQAFTVTKPIYYAFTIDRQPDYLPPKLGLSQMGKIMFSDLFNIKIECEPFNESCTLYEVDRIVFNQLLNNVTLPNSLSIKNNIQSIIPPKVQSTLQYQICCDKSSLTFPSYQYRWTSPLPQKQNFYKPFDKSNAKLYFDKNGAKPGIYYTFQSIFISKDFQKCGPVPTNTSLDIKFYGGKQQFASFTLFQNVLRQSNNFGILDTILNRQNWSTKTFRFYVGQLFDIISNLSTKFSHNTDINGSCFLNKDSQVNKASNATLEVLMDYKCQIYTDTSIKIMQFEMALDIKISILLKQSSMDFWIKSLNNEITYQDDFGYKILKKNSADKIVNDTLHKLYDNRLFGSGWPYLMKRTNPAMLVLQNSLLIYDKVPSSLILNE